MGREDFDSEVDEGWSTFIGSAGLEGVLRPFVAGCVGVSDLGSVRTRLTTSGRGMLWQKLVSDMTCNDSNGTYLFMASFVEERLGLSLPPEVPLTNWARGADGVGAGIVLALSLG